jgi:hypothetical protein
MMTVSISDGSMPMERSTASALLRADGRSARGS